MIIKSFVAETIADALKMIRTELGGKAVVLKTKILNLQESGTGRRMVEITACLETPTVGQLELPEVTTQFNKAVGIPVEPEIERVFSSRGKVGAASASGNSTGNAIGKAANKPAGALPRVLPREEVMSTHPKAPHPVTADSDAQIRRLEEKLDAILALQSGSSSSSRSAARVLPNTITPFYDALVSADIPERFCEPLMARLSSRIAQKQGANISELALAMITEEFAAHSMPSFGLEPGQTVLFIGPAGSGKTTALGKVAVDLLFTQKKKVTLATLDDFKVAAQEEISGYAEALGASVVDAVSQKAMARAAGKISESVLLVDCHSNVTDQRHYNELLTRTRALNPDVVALTISALTRSDDLSKLIRRFEAFHPTHLIVTHTDLTDAVGGIYTAMRLSGLKLAAISNTAGSVNRLLAPDPAAMARTLFTREVEHAE